MNPFRDFEHPIREPDVTESKLETELPDDIRPEVYKDGLPDDVRPDADVDELPNDIRSDVYEDELPDDVRPDDVPDGTVENDSPEDIAGGSYQDVKKNSDGERHEVHHMPADSASDLNRDVGPAIRMDKEDHRQTASCGNSREAREYRERQKDLIADGKFREALQMDIDDIRDKFGDKYDDAIAQMLDYVDQLEGEGIING